MNFSYTMLELNREKITPFFSYQLKAPARSPKVKKSDDGTYIGYF
ncbi:hypothetical protein [Legionella fairfieldensis]|nr:hypothetical protein [Legionella fairfieldensis]